MSWQNSNSLNFRPAHMGGDMRGVHYGINDSGTGQNSKWLNFRLARGSVYERKDLDFITIVKDTDPRKIPIR